MRYFGLVFIGSLLFTTITHGQEDNPVEFLAAGKWGLQFQIRTGSSLLPQVSSFQGNVISGKYQTSPNTALRVGLSVSFSGNFGEGEINQTGDNAEIIIFDNNSTGGGIEITTQYIWYLVQYEEVYFFSGLGPLVQGHYNSYNDERDTTSYKNSSFGFGIGGTVVAGVEWLCLDWLSLSAEYGSSLVYSYRRDKFDQTRPSYSQNQNNSWSSINFSTREIRIGSTIYF